MLEERGQLRRSPAEAFDSQWRVPVPSGVLEVEADTILTQPAYEKQPKVATTAGAAMASPRVR
jgi:hypothetical protein